MSYQAVIRNTSGALVTSTSVGMKISILQGTATGTVAYSETQIASTNANGLVSLEIGSGTVVSGTFAGINWANGPYFIKTYTDPSGGINYTIVGSSQLLSVPYALFSANGTPGPQGPTGPTGPTGLTGSAGAIGPQGPIGLTGAVGATGAQGPIGLTGAIGATGAQGPIGLTGAVGAQGPIGLTGATGPQGPIGLTGASGPQGIQGLPGATGLTGAQGIQGPQGIAGTNGNDGATGPQGPIGLTGAVGSIGPQGPIGLTGAVGATGLTGPTGAVGATGPQGPIGLTGSAGAIGSQGPIGLTGAVGATGSQGPIGLTGAQGSNGFTALVKTTAELAGSNCATGGTKIETGLDANNNGILDLAEVNAAQTTYVCNGLGGALSNGNAQGQTLFWNGSSWVNLAPGITGQTLNFCYNAPQWGPCLPLITTLDVSNITGYVASSGVTIIANGGYSITSAGICWSVNPNPTILDSINTNGNYSSTTALNLSNLIPGTTYYVRAYATNAGGTGYGNQLTFITGAALPTISTMTASNITFNSAIVGGNVSNDGGASVTSNGVCWSTSQNPTLVNSNLTIGQGLGSFNDTINGLSGNTTYYVRAFATNASGTAYGNQVSFNTYPTPSAQSCTGGYGGLSSIGSSLMNQQGFIIANIGQVVDLTMTLSSSTFNPCPGPNYSNACTNFFNPPEANLLTYNCGQQILSETISFNLSGTYNITGIGRSFFGQINTCNVSVYVP
jgi:hypothetical protein